LIDAVYADRQRRFPSSTPEVQRAVRSRLEEERRHALGLLAGGGLLDAEV